MIPPEELLPIKLRLVIAGEAANRIASTNPDSRVFYDEEEYARVLEALAYAKSDISRVLAELDVLRGIVDDRMVSFMGGIHAEGQRSDGTVGAVQEQEGVGSGEAGGANDEGVAVGVPAGGTNRRRRKGPKSKRDKEGVSAIPSVVDGGSGAEPVDGR